MFIYNKAAKPNFVEKFYVDHRLGSLKKTFNLNWTKFKYKKIVALNYCLSADIAH